MAELRDFKNKQIKKLNQQFLRYVEWINLSSHKVNRTEMKLTLSKIFVWNKCKRSQCLFSYVNLYTQGVLKRNKNIGTYLVTPSNNNVLQSQVGHSLKIYFKCFLI